ncbi:MAG TPA: ABC transporter substrate-binding protein [Acidimicrobiales bacterium]
MGPPDAFRLLRTVRLVAAVALAAAAACGSGDGGRDRAGDREAAPPPGVGVASFDFAESRLVAEIYAQALEEQGVAVRREIGLGPRELVQPALRQGFVDVVPEYLGSALRSVEPASAADPGAPAEVRAALAAAVEPLGLRVLEPAPAQNQNGLAVTRRTAARLDLAVTSDLRPVAAELTVGGPPECPARPYCLPGLGDAYGLRFAAFRPFADQALVRQALRDGVIDVGVLFTTDGALAGGDLVLLDDDRGLQPVENLVPVVRAAVLDAPGGERVAAALDAVSGRLTTANLRFLNWRVTVAGRDPAAEAHGWLARQGLVAR